jgi:hypothetical protein
MSKYDENDVTSSDKEFLSVLKKQQGKVESLQDRHAMAEAQLEDTIRSAEELARQQDIIFPVRDCSLSLQQHSSSSQLVMRPWTDILSEATASAAGTEISICDLLSIDEIACVEDRIAQLSGDFDSFHRLDSLDWSISGVSGLLAALVDILFIKSPKLPSFINTPGAEGGPLSNWIRERINSTISPSELRQLEQYNWVPFDPTNSKGLDVPVDGLSASVHRFRSLGHDPILGFLFGVVDILRGTFTAIDGNGHLIVQAVDIAGRDIAGMNLFDAITRLVGHLKSDITTSAGLPAPLMPLLQFCQFGKFGSSEMTVGELATVMYRSGYDFRHFVTMSISPLMIDVFVRLFYFIKRMHEGHSIEESIPFNLPGHRKPKLQTMLFSAHLLSTAANAGKVAITQNPFAINYPQWLAFFTYTYQQLKWTLYEKEDERFKFVQTHIDEGWENLAKGLSSKWNFAFPEVVEM